MAWWVPLALGDSHRGFPVLGTTTAYFEHFRFGDRELVLRRPPFGSKVKTAHDMGREHRILSRQLLAEILEPRVEEIFDLVKREIVRAGYEGMLGAGVVITGGTSLLEGMPDAAERGLNLPARRGAPTGVPSA